MHQAETEIPLFLQADKPETWAKPLGTSWGDHMLKPGKPLSPRHKQLARMIAEGKTTNEIAEKLDLTAGRVSVLRSNTEIMKEAERVAEKLFDITVQERLKHLGPHAADLLEEIFISDSSAITMSHKIDAAKWIVEKLTGKARQEIDVQHSTLQNFIDLMKQMKDSGETIDVTPKPVELLEATAPNETPVNLFAKWVDEET